jgi:hypothetical protein
VPLDLKSVPKAGQGEEEGSSEAGTVVSLISETWRVEDQQVRKD